MNQKLRFLCNLRNLRNLPLIPGNPTGMHPSGRNPSGRHPSERNPSGRRPSKLLTLALALLLLLQTLAFSSCGSKVDDFVFYGVDSDGDYVKGSGFTEGMFGYFLSQRKAEYYAVLLYNDSSIKEDSPALWQRTAPDGRTYEESFFADAVSEAKSIVAANTLLFTLPSADNPKKRYTLPENYLDYIDGVIRENAVQNYGSVMAFESYLMNFGATLEDYTELYLMTANVDLLKEALFNDETGSMTISEQDKKAYFTENYYTVRHIFVNTAYDEKIDKTRAPLSAAEAANRERTAQEIYEFLANGGTYTEAADRFARSYVTAYEGTSAMDITAPTVNAPELGEALKEMELNEVRMVKSDYGYHIIKRVATHEADFDAEGSGYDAIRASVTSTLIDKRYQELLDGFDRTMTDSEKLAGFSVTDAVLP